MPNIFMTASNYTGKYASINTNVELPIRCRKIDLYRSIITVGNPSFISYNSIRINGLARALYDSIIEKASLVAVNIESDQYVMRRHRIFDNYVSDKKKTISYNLGMAFAKFYSEKILEIPHLIHVEHLKKAGAIEFTDQENDGRPREPDLVGQKPDGSWHIVEAKGVSTSETQLPGKIADAKKQIQQIATIHGEEAETGNACATYIGADRILTHLQDPPASGRTHVTVNVNKLYDSYYAPFTLSKSIIDEKTRMERIDGIDVEFLDLPGPRRIRIGLASELIDIIASKNYDRIADVNKSFHSLDLTSRESDKYSIGLDGFVLGYSDY